MLVYLVRSAQAWLESVPTSPCKYPVVSGLRMFPSRTVITDLAAVSKMENVQRSHEKISSFVSTLHSWKIPQHSYSVNIHKYSAVSSLGMLNHSLEHWSFVGQSSRRLVKNIC